MSRRKTPVERVQTRKRIGIQRFNEIRFVLRVEWVLGAVRTWRWANGPSCLRGRSSFHPILPTTTGEKPGGCNTLLESTWLWSDFESKTTPEVIRARSTGPNWTVNIHYNFSSISNRWPIIVLVTIAEKNDIAISDARECSGLCQMLNSAGSSLLCCWCSHATLRLPGTIGELKALYSVVKMTF
jgi:hypothetical protein